MPIADDATHPPPPDAFLRRLSEQLLPVSGWGEFRRGARAAAVVALLVRRGAAWDIPFVVRRTDLPHHPGQVGLPGGTLRRGEEPWTAATRELSEELGISPAGVRPLGAGQAVYAAVSNFSVVPYVAWFEQPDPVFTPDVHELDGILEVPVDRLLDESAWQMSELPLVGRHFMWEGRVVWGMTERVLSDLLPRLERALGPA